MIVVKKVYAIITTPCTDSLVIGSTFLVYLGISTRMHIHFSDVLSSFMVFLLSIIYHPEENSLESYILRSIDVGKRLLSYWTLNLHTPVFVQEI